MEANTDDTKNTVIDNTIVDSQYIPLPLGQNNPTSSKSINTNYIVSSLLEDPSLTSDDEPNQEENTILGDVSNNEKTAVFASTDVRKKEGSKVNVEVAPKDAPRNVLQTNDTDKGKLKNDTNKGELKNDKGDKLCSYFLKGQCRHGFSGKVTKDNVECC